MVLKIGNKKNKMISISKKERNLLLALGIAVLLWASNQYTFTPQQAKIDNLNEDKLAKQEELSKINTTLANEATVSTELIGLNKDFATVAEKYFPKIDQPELMNIVNHIVDNSKLKIPNIAYSDPTKVEELNSDLMETTIPFTGTYNDLSDFFSQVRDNPKRLLVSTLSLAKDKGDVINGQISLDAYTYDKQGNLNEGYFYNNPFISTSKFNPFKPFDGYVEIANTQANESGNGSGNIPDWNSSSTPQEKRFLIDDMEGSNVYFLGTSADVTGKIGKINFPKFDKSAIRAEYFISTGYKTERAFVVLDDKNITLKYPPQSIGVWAYAYGYSPVTIGFRFKDADGKDIYTEVKKGVDWNGWQYISATPPQDLNVYPLILDRIYFELGANRDDYGVMLFDRIECSLPMDETLSSNDTSSRFYTVKSGDTLMTISEMFYGTQSEYTRIIKDNGLEKDATLPLGKVLVISK